MELNLPHNVLMMEDGRKLYLIVRDFDLNIGWLQMAGVYLVIGE